MYCFKYDFENDEIYGLCLEFKVELSDLKDGELQAELENPS